MSGWSNISIMPKNVDGEIGKSVMDEKIAVPGPAGPLPLARPSS